MPPAHRGATHLSRLNGFHGPGRQLARARPSELALPHILKDHRNAPSEYHEDEWTQAAGMYVDNEMV